MVSLPFALRALRNALRDSNALRHVYCVRNALRNAQRQSNALRNALRNALLWCQSNALRNATNMHLVGIEPSTFRDHSQTFDHYAKVPTSDSRTSQVLYGHNDME